MNNQPDSDFIIINTVSGLLAFCRRSLIQGCIDPLEGNLSDRLVVTSIQTYRVREEEAKRISALLIGDTPTPVPTPVEVVDENWFGEFRRIAFAWKNETDPKASFVEWRKVVWFVKDHIKAMQTGIVAPVTTPPSDVVNVLSAMIDDVTKQIGHDLDMEAQGVYGDTSDAYRIKKVLKQFYLRAVDIVLSNSTTK
jgi:hypothetical protein